MQFSCPQCPGEDFNEMFAPTLHNPSLLTLFTVAAHEDVKIGQVGVRAVFIWKGKFHESSQGFSPDSIRTCVEAEEKHVQPKATAHMCKAVHKLTCESLGLVFPWFRV